MRILIQTLFLAMAFALAQASDPVSKSYTETGNASIYSTHISKKTASGERYDPEKLTAAHRKLPLGSTVKVTNLRNGKCVTVCITDRGPYCRHRIIDLSMQAAKQLDMVRDGTVKVKLAIVDLPKPSQN